MQLLAAAVAASHPACHALPLAEEEAAPLRRRRRGHWLHRLSALLHGAGCMGPAAARMGPTAGRMVAHGAMCGWPVGAWLLIDVHRSWRPSHGSCCLHLRGAAVVGVTEKAGFELYAHPAREHTRQQVVTAAAQATRRRQH